LTRHGTTAWSQSGRHTSTTDVDLTPEGEEQARSLAARLAADEFSLVLVSPRRRARRTAELAGVGSRAVVDPDLAEWAYGDYEGLTTEQIREQDPGWTVFSRPCPNGETAAQVSARADRVIDRVRALDGGLALLVAHGHLLRVLAARWAGLPATYGAHLELDVATVSKLSYEHDVPTVEVWNA